MITHPKPIQIGFTGTSKSVPSAQRAGLMRCLLNINPSRISYAHHGDCINADRWFHDACAFLGIPVHLHPPTNSKARAFCAGSAAIADALPYLKRNDEIVKAADYILAMPYQFEEQQYGGTWYTVRRARKMEKPICLIFPDGEVYYEGDWGEIG